MMDIMPAATSRKELTHDRILDVAARAIRRAGYDGVGLATIMKEAGLTHGGFYAHFASRDALLAEATQRAGRDTGAVLVERIGEGGGRLCGRNAWPGAEPQCCGDDGDEPASHRILS